VLSSPSGAGKTTLSRRLLASDDDITMSVSVTTRPPREGEVDGKDYHFISVAQFERMRADGELLESAKVFDNYYGTPRAEVEAALAAGRDVMFDIDWQGTQQLGAEMDDDLVRIFVLPPSAAALEERLKSRAKDPPEVVARRMAKASGEISHWAEYDYVLVNDDIDRCERAISQILRVERLRRKRQIGLVDFVRSLQAEL
jgi:guanylate kinase